MGVGGTLLFGGANKTPTNEISKQKIPTKITQSLSTNITSKDRVLEIANVANENTTRVALIKDGKVINTVIVPIGWTGKKGEWQPPEGTQTILSETAGTGDIYEDGKFYRVQKATKAEPTIEEISKKKKLTGEEKDILIKYLLEEQLKK